jgi:hypothetical protein
MQVTGLDPTAFESLFNDDAALAERGGRKVIADGPGYPCRVSLEDARAGDELVLVPYAHHVVDTPYRASGPVYVRRGATRFSGTALPAMLRTRILSVRAYDAHGNLVDADVCPGSDVDPIIARMLADDAIGYLHVHLAKPGCFACRIDR